MDFHTFFADFFFFLIGCSLLMLGFQSLSSHLPNMILEKCRNISIIIIIIIIIFLAYCSIKKSKIIPSLCQFFFFFLILYHFGTISN